MVVFLIDIGYNLIVFEIFWVNGYFEKKEFWGWRVMYCFVVLGKQIF